MTCTPGNAPDRPLIVKKFGGTSVANVERMREVARLSCESQRAGNDVVLVVSAMSGETDRLLSLAHQVLPLPDLRELDVIVATGEQVSCALVALAIQAQGGKACSVLGYQLPLLTDDAFGNARIQSVERARIDQALARGQIPVVAGFQGVDGDQNVTTLGRGGSNATAVMLAAVLGAAACEFNTDVEGVYTADPRVVPSCRKLLSVSYEEMLEMASLGAKVLQARSVEIAMKYRVPVHVRSSFTSKEGTWVLPREQAIGAEALTAVVCAREQVWVELACVPWHASTLATLSSLLSDSHVSVDMVDHAAAAPGGARADLTFTLPRAELVRKRQSLERTAASLGAAELRVSGGLAKVSLIGAGIRSDARIAAHARRSLLQQHIAVPAVVVSELRMSCLVDEAAADQAVCILHDAFDLAHDNGAPAPQ